MLIIYQSRLLITYLAFYGKLKIFLNIELILWNDPKRFNIYFSLNGHNSNGM